MRGLRRNPSFLEMTLPADQVNEIILDELRGLRTEVREGFSETLQRITAVEAVTKPFFENEGGKEKMQDEINELKKSKWMIVGGAGALSGVFHWIVKHLG